MAALHFHLCRHMFRLAMASHSRWPCVFTSIGIYYSLTPWLAYTIPPFVADTAQFLYVFCPAGRGQEDHFAGQDMLGWGIRTEAVPYNDPTRTHSNPGRYARQYHRISHSPSQVGAVISLRLRYSTLNIKDYKPNQAGTRTRVLPPPGGVSCPQWAQAISLPGGAGSWRL